MSGGRNWQVSFLSLPRPFLPPDAPSPWLHPAAPPSTSDLLGGIPRRAFVRCVLFFFPPPPHPTRVFFVFPPGVPRRFLGQEDILPGETPDDLRRPESHVGGKNMSECTPRKLPLPIPWRLGCGNRREESRRMEWTFLFLSLSYFSASAIILINLG